MNAQTNDSKNPHLEGYRQQGDNNQKQQRKQQGKQNVSQPNQVNAERIKSFSLRVGIRNFFYVVFGINALFVLFVPTGGWSSIFNWFYDTSTPEGLLTYQLVSAGVWSISLIIPLGAMIWLYILDN